MHLLENGTSISRRKDSTAYLIDKAVRDISRKAKKATRGNDRRDPHHRFEGWGGNNLESMLKGDEWTAYFGVQNKNYVNFYAQARFPSILTLMPALHYIV